jgi:hypothetical protein
MHLSAIDVSKKLPVEPVEPTVDLRRVEPDYNA